MQAANQPGSNVATIGGGKKKTKGRQDASGQPAKMSSKEVLERIDNLVDLQIKAKIAADAAAEAITATAEK
jgi:hypothetical protein